MSSYTISSVEAQDQRIMAHVLVHEEDRLFDGHFPEKKVVPGVLMIDMVGAVLSRQLSRTVHLASASQIKFVGMWLPDECSEAQLSIEMRGQVDDVYSVSASIQDGDRILFTCKGKFA